VVVITGESWETPPVPTHNISMIHGYSTQLWNTIKRPCFSFPWYSPEIPKPPFQVSSADEGQTTSHGTKHHLRTMQSTIPHNANSPSQTEASTDDQRFGLFLKLPLELQLAVWEFAIIPNCIEIKRHDVDNGRSTNDLIIKRHQPAVLYVCRDSRRIALNLYGAGGHTVSYIWPKYTQPDYEQNVVGTIYFQPSQYKI